jgi:hypothetical protein
MYPVWTQTSDGATAGPSGGGGGAGGASSSGAGVAAGGNVVGFGGGGGSNGVEGGAPLAATGNGANGIIVITYTPGATAAVSRSFGCIIG